MKCKGLICPMCLTEFPFRPEGEVFKCPGCRADEKPVVLMDTVQYLATVDFGVVADFWNATPDGKADLKWRVLDRVQKLRERQRAEFGTVPLLGRTSDPRVTIKN